MSERFRLFAKDLLEANDALVSCVDPLGLEVILPVELQQTLDLPEHGMLAFSGNIPDGWRRVMLESDWLDRLGGLLAERGRETQLCPVAPMLSAPANPERILEHQLRLNNAVFRLQGVEECWTRCLLHTFRYSAISDEKRDGIVHIGRNLSNEGVLDPWVMTFLRTCRENPDGLESRPFPVDSCQERHDPDVWRRLSQQLLPRLVHEQLKSFLNGMHRRQQRDLDRLHGYHTDLRQEVFSRLATAARKGEDKLEEERRRGTLRLEAIAREYHAKAADLYEKYALTIRVERVQSLLLESRVFRFRLLIKRRKGERAIHLDWHPIIRHLEEPPCEAGLPFGEERIVCDEALHLVSIEGFAPCVGCHKPFCRACHPNSCPRCQHRGMNEKREVSSDSCVSL